MTLHTSRYRILLAALALVAVACGQSAHRGPVATRVKPSPSASPSPSPSPSPALVDPALPAPLPGTLPGQTLPLSAPLPYPLLIQIENTAPSRPQAGLDAASLIFQYITEAGITRFSAIYHRVPGVVGPVRSARFISQYLYHRFDAVLMASGAGDATLTRVVRDPGITGGFFNDYAPQYFFRWNGRAAPHNVYTRQDQMLAIAGQGLRPPASTDLLRSNDWGGGVAAPHIDVPGMHSSFDWDGTSYSVVTDGQVQADVIYGAVRPQSIVVMHVRQFTTPEIHDVNGVLGRDFDMNSGGAVELYAHGTVISGGKWVSPGEKLPLQFFDAAGQQVGLPPGLAWVVLAE
jgi:hypothetical protein